MTAEVYVRPLPSAVISPDKGRGDPGAGPPTAIRVPLIVAGAGGGWEFDAEVHPPRIAAAPNRLNFMMIVTVGRGGFQPAGRATTGLESAEHP